MCCVITDVAKLTLKVGLGGERGGASTLSLNLFTL